MPCQLKSNNVFTRSPVASHFSADTSKLQLVVLNLESRSEQTISVFICLIQNQGRHKNERPCQKALSK